MEEQILHLGTQRQSAQVFHRLFPSLNERLTGAHALFHVPGNLLAGGDYARNAGHVLVEVHPNRTVVVYLKVSSGGEVGRE